MGKVVFTSNKGLRSCTDKNYLLETVSQCVSNPSRCSPQLANLHPCWAGLSHLWWRNGQVCLSFGHDKSWGSSPRQGRCFWITWWNTPPCCAKYPASTGWVTCAFPPALLLHPAYLEPSSTSWNFNHISFLNTSLSHITAQQKSLESTEDEFYPSTSIYLRRSLQKKIRNKEIWLWRKNSEAESQGLLEKRPYRWWLCSWWDKEQQFLPTETQIIHSPQSAVLESM